jgi:branched-chain amino acid transport system substrate-binding protein
VVGYATFTAIFEALRKAKSTDTERLIAAMRGLEWTTPFGPAVFRRLDHQSTMGAYVGKLDVRDGKGTMIDWRYADGAKFLPSDAEVARRRPADAQK